MDFELHQGDCLEVLRGMADNSVDSIVTDSPYGLKFMGKKWDYDVPRVEVWAECLRVLKPGGHLLAFAGTRTQHRMAVRIEDAGFEIRDMIMWTYASGFPKSHNLDNLRGDKICGCAEPYTQNGAKQKTECDLRSMRIKDVSKAKSTGEERREVLQPLLPKQSAPANEPQAADYARSEQPGMEGRCDTPQAQGQLCAGTVCAGSCMGCADGASGRVCDGAPSCDGADVRLPADAGGVRAPCGSCAAEQCQRQSGAVAGQPEPQAVGAWPVCGGCGLPVVPRGLGTALKPALEPITVARKPLVGAVAENVLAHGTGAINIDGCRVEAYDGTTTAPKPSSTANTTSYGKSEQMGGVGSDIGRWPANLIHDGSEEVLSAFPQSPGQQGDLKETGRTRPSSGRFGDMAPPHAHAARGDTGSAARFFYCAKASKADRDEGLEAFTKTSGGMVSNTSGQHMTRRDEGYEVAPRANNHPTVKPTDLMRYLCRLVTPPGGMVLDPFTGSGSTGKAAMLEGFRFIGIEREADFVAIARARVEHAIVLRKSGMQKLKPAVDRDDKTFDLFGDVA